MSIWPEVCKCWMCLQCPALIAQHHCKSHQFSRLHPARASCRANQEVEIPSAEWTQKVSLYGSKCEIVVHPFLPAHMIPFSAVRHFSDMLFTTVSCSDPQALSHFQHCVCAWKAPAATSWERGCQNWESLYSSPLKINIQGSPQHSLKMTM